MDERNANGGEHVDHASTVYAPPPIRAYTSEPTRRQFTGGNKKKKGRKVRAAYRIFHSCLHLEKNPKRTLVRAHFGGG